MVSTVTLIIYHKGTVYSDRIVSNDGCVLGQATKIFLKDNKVLAASGLSGDCQKFTTQYPDIIYKDVFSANHSTGYAFYFINGTPTVQVHDQRGMSEYSIIDQIFATGFGDPFALGLLFTQTPIEKVFDLVSMYYPIVHGPIDSIKVPHE